MALKAKGGIKLIEGKAYIHPLTLEELHFLILKLNNSKFEGKDVEIIYKIIYKLQEEYKLVKQHKDK